MRKNDALPGKCLACPVRLHGGTCCWRDLQDQVGLLSQYGVQRLLPRGEPLYHQGDRAGGWWIVRRGHVLEFMVDGAGREQILRLAPSGSVVGLCGLRPSLAHWASARAGRQGAEVAYISREEGRRLMLENPDLGFALLSGMAEEVRFAYHKMHGLAVRPARASIANALLSATECSPDGCSRVTLTRSEIASMVGVAVETAVRTLTEFRGQGLIRDAASRQIELLDPCGLHAIAEGLDEEPGS